MYRPTDSVCLTPGVPEYFIHRLSEDDRLRRSRDSKFVEASETQPPLFVSATSSCNAE